MKKYLFLMFFFLGFFLFAQQEENYFTQAEIGGLIKYTQYHKNGQLYQTGYIRNNKLHGEWTSYDQKGNKISIGSYKNGKKTSKWFFWKDNSLIEVDFIDNKIRKTVIWTDSKSTS